MTIQLDTNVLARIAQPTHPHPQIALTAKQRLESRGDALCIVPQHLYEFWVVATRSIAENGLGLVVADAKAEIDRIRAAFPLNPDSPVLLDEWERLVVAHDCKGKSAHDARIVAAMKLHAVTQLLTFNTKDFTRYTDIAVLD